MLTFNSSISNLEKNSLTGNLWKKSYNSALKIVQEAFVNLDNQNKTNVILDKAIISKLLSDKLNLKSEIKAYLVYSKSITLFARLVALEIKESKINKQKELTTDSLVDDIFKKFLNFYGAPKIEANQIYFSNPINVDDGSALKEYENAFKTSTFFMITTRDQCFNYTNIFDYKKVVVDKGHQDWNTPIILYKEKGNPLINIIYMYFLETFSKFGQLLNSIYLPIVLGCFEAPAQGGFSAKIDLDKLKNL